MQEKKQREEGRDDLLLSSMIDQDAIQLNVEAKDWKEAIRKSAQPLLDKKKITEEYVRKIISIALETGPYIVVAKNIALPHAPSESGVLETAMSISVLKDSVKFGNKENDPVKYLFCLSAVDSESHLEALAELVELIDDEKFLCLLNNTVSRTVVLEYVKEKEKSIRSEKNV